MFKKSRRVFFAFAKMTLISRVLPRSLRPSKKLTWRPGLVDEGIAYSTALLYPNRPVVFLSEHNEPHVTTWESSNPDNAKPEGSVEILLTGSHPVTKMEYDSILKFLEKRKPSKCIYLTATVVAEERDAIHLRS